MYKKLFKRSRPKRAFVELVNQNDLFKKKKFQEAKYNNLNQIFRGLTRK